MQLPTLKPQEVAYDDPASCNFFRPFAGKPFVVTRGAAAVYGIDIISRCLELLQVKAAVHQGLDYLQVFTDPARQEPLWFIEDGDGGAITALLPSEY